VVGMRRIADRRRDRRHRRFVTVIRGTFRPSVRTFLCWGIVRRRTARGGSCRGRGGCR
jgi:hypothetical protein